MEGENYDDRPLEDAKKAAKTFVNCMGSYDRIEVISFANYVTVDQSFTSDKQALCNAIDSLQSDGATALYDAIWQGLDDTDLEVNSRKAIIALTDGAENCSSNNHGGGDYNFTYSYWSEYPDNSLLINYANSLNIPVYTVGLQGFNFTREKVIRDYSTTEADLKEIAEETGGDYFYAPTSVDLKNIYEEITQRLEQQYIITFTDNTGVTEGYITVKLNYNQLYGEDTKEYNPTTNLAIICIDPSEPGVNQSKQWISILGNNFVEDTEVTFKKGGDTYLIPPERIYFIDSTKIKVFVGLTCTGEWKVHVKNPDGQESEYTFNVSQFKANIIPEKLLDLIDELLLDSPDSYYRDTWKINQNQYKAWIATIAWAEGGMGGFTAHSQGNEGRDYFPHRSLGYDFTFSTGIGPFQIDNGGDYGGTPWEEWSTIDKLDPKKTLEAVMKQHHEQFQGESNLLNFSQNSRYLENSFKWYGVDQDPDGDIESKWETITGSKWKDNNNDRNESLDWENIKERLENDDPNYSYESNVRCLGDRKWNIEAGDIFTNANNPVIFDGDYLTWRITARDEYGIEKFCYYYTYNPYTKIEVWCYGDNSNYKEIFVREYSKEQRPQDPEGDETRGFGFTLEDSALTP